MNEIQINRCKSYIQKQLSLNIDIETKSMQKQSC